MKAWQFIATGAPLELRDVPVPHLQPDEVLINVMAAGICHSDVGAMTDPGWLAIMTAVPRTLGHEIAGVVADVGTEVSEYRVGDRVGVVPIPPYNPGFGRDGGFAEQTVMPEAALVRIPDGVSFAQAAAATDAGLSAYHAVAIEAQVAPGMKVGIIGVGGLGQVGARVAVLLGADVYAAEINTALWPSIRDLGVSDVATDIIAFADVELDVVVDFAGFGGTTSAALKAVRPGGRVVLVGLGRLSAELDTMDFVAWRKQLIGSSGGTPSDVESVFALIAAGDLTPNLTNISFDEIPEGLKRLADGQVTGRLVADLSSVHV